MKSQPSPDSVNCPSGSCSAELLYYTKSYICLSKRFEVHAEHFISEVLPVGIQLFNNEPESKEILFDSYNSIHYSLSNILHTVGTQTLVVEANRHMLSLKIRNVFLKCASSTCGVWLADWFVYKRMLYNKFRIDFIDCKAF